MKNISLFLQEKKLKKTPLRVSLLEIFSEVQEPITIADIETLVKKKGVSVNQTSIYRQIETLVEKDVLQSIILKNSTAYYELQTHHHHHFICDECEEIECVNDETLETQIHSLEEKLSKQGLQISSHQFSFHGKCKTCSL